MSTGIGTVSVLMSMDESGCLDQKTGRRFYPTCLLLSGIQRGGGSNAQCLEEPWAFSWRTGLQRWLFRCLVMGLIWVSDSSHLQRLLTSEMAATNDRSFAGSVNCSTDPGGVCTVSRSLWHVLRRCIQYLFLKMALFGNRETHVRRYAQCRVASAVVSGCWDLEEHRPQSSKSRRDLPSGAPPCCQAPFMLSVLDVL